ncbi:MAG: Gfo/Idh/MocA family oxidoreductase, partial [Martelella sp.]
MTRYTAAYAAEISAFIDSIENGTAPSPSIEDGLMALALADAAVQAVKEQKTIAVG